jgi:uncharacterized membrane protein YdfJ with MMPL/SSD domain
MGHTDSAAATRAVYVGMVLLAVVTLIEVGISLYGKGHLGAAPTSTIALGIVGFLLIALSLYKAYFIIFKFMHMGDEVRGLKLTVLLPVLLLGWAVFAFFNEGASYKERRDRIYERNDRTEAPADATKQTGQLIKELPELKKEN